MFPVKTASDRAKEVQERLKALAEKAKPVVGASPEKSSAGSIPANVKAVAEQLDGLSVGDILSLGDTEQVHALRLRQFKPDKDGKVRYQYSLYDTWNLLPVKVIDGVKVMSKYQIVLEPEVTPEA